eukprot:12515-Prymnesium_polylepis.1
MLHGRSAALPGRRESAALGSRFLRERPANHAGYLHQLLFTAGCAVYGVPRFLSSIADEKFAVE